jgi:hypothetical protein
MLGAFNLELSSLNKGKERETGKGKKNNEEAERSQ